MVISQELFPQAEALKDAGSWSLAHNVIEIIDVHDDAHYLSVRVW